MFAHDNPCLQPEKGEKGSRSLKSQQKDAKKAIQMGLKKKDVVICDKKTNEAKEPRGSDRSQKKRGLGRFSCSLSVDTSNSIKRKIKTKFSEKNMEKSSNENLDSRENCQVSDPDTIWGYVLNHEKAANTNPA